MHSQQQQSFKRPFVRDYPGDPVPEETFTYSLFTLRAWQSFCTTSLHVLFWSTSWSGALHLIFHTFIHPISVFFSFLTISSYLNHRSYNKTFYNNLSISDSRFLDTACIINKLLQVLLSSHYYYFRPSVGIFPREFKN